MSASKSGNAMSFNRATLAISTRTSLPSKTFGENATPNLVWLAYPAIGPIGASQDIYVHGAVLGGVTANVCCAAECRGNRGGSRPSGIGNLSAHHAYVTSPRRKAEEP
jgi:hypothetical protein